MQSPFVKHPLVPVAVMLIAGIIIADYVPWSVGPWIAVTAFSSVCALALKRFPVLQTMGTMLCVCLVGILLAKSRTKVAFSPRYQEEYEAVLLSDPVERGKVARCDMLVTKGRLQECKVKAAILRDTVANAWQRLHIGDGVVACSPFEAPVNYIPKNGKKELQGNFRYTTYMRANGFVATTFIPYESWKKASIRLDGLSFVWKARLTALKWRSALAGIFRECGLDGQALAVLTAMTLGDKSMIDAELRQVYSLSGASHILALSGLHLGIIYGLLSLIGRRRNRGSIHRRPLVWTEILTLSCLWGYAVLTGLSPSVVRSATMLTMLSIIHVSGRGGTSLNTLSLAAVVMLVVNPDSLYDVGFMMSFIAVAGILIITPFIDSVPRWQIDGGVWRKRNRVLAKWLWSAVSVSMGAQLAVLPLVLYFFGRSSVWFLLTNLIVTPMAMIIIILAIILLFLSRIPMVSTFVAFVLGRVLDSLNCILTAIASLPGNNVLDVTLSSVEVILFYALIIIVLMIAGLLGKGKR